MSVISLSLKLVILIVVGFVVKKIKVLPAGFEKGLTRLLLDVALPAIIIQTFIADDAALSGKDVLILLAVAVGVIAVSAVVGQIFCIARHGSALGKVDRLSVIVTNFTFFGVPVMETLFGTQGLLYFTIFCIPIRLVYYMGTPLLLVGKAGGVKETLKNFFSAPVVAIGIGAILYFANIKLPDAITGAVSSLASTATPLGLILCGATLTDVDFKQLVRRPVVLLTVAVRLVVLPAIVLILVLLLKIPTEAARCAVIYTALPVASMIPTYVIRYMPEETESQVSGGLLVLISTLICIVTIPLWASVLARFL